MNTYGKTFMLMKAYSRLPKLERDIIEHLFETDVLDCTYSSMAKMLDSDISNLRKSLLRLEKLGVICIVKETTHMVAFFVGVGWVGYFLENSNAR